jgi:hypothetical protein
LTENLVELSTGGSMELSENGDLRMEMPNGMTISTRNNVPPPEGFPLPIPWEGATPQSVVEMTGPDGHQVIVTYVLERPRTEALDIYEAFLMGNEGGTDVERKKESVTGIVTEVVTGRLATGENVTITGTEAFGQNSLSLILEHLEGEGDAPEGGVTPEVADTPDEVGSQAEAEVAAEEGSAK